MDPKSRPTFEQLAVQLEQMVQRHGAAAERTVDANCDAMAGANAKAGDAHATSAAVQTRGVITTADAAVDCRPSEQQPKPSHPCSKFDQDVYLVPGSSPSEKARCHYLQGRAVKEKVVK